MFVFPVHGRGTCSSFSPQVMVFIVVFIVMPMFIVMPVT